MSEKNHARLGDLKQRIIQQGLDRRAATSADHATSHTSPNSFTSNIAHSSHSSHLAHAASSLNISLSSSPQERVTSGRAEIPEAFTRFSQHPAYQQLRLLNEMALYQGVDNPYFTQHEGTAGATTVIHGKTCINFSSYNYLGFSGDPEINAAAKAAIDQYGTSVSASRVVSGERPIHRMLEAEIARLYGVDDAIVMVSGHATNVTTIGYLFGPRDLILHDAFIHNSALQGIELSGAKRFSFAHNDVNACEALLREHRAKFERVLIIVEGIYSMDGDFPDLPEFIALKNRYKAFLMVDEAHSFGVMGKTGMGLREHFGIDGREVDIWMGTLSKTLAGCGGYIAGEIALVEHLKFLAPGFLYSVGMPPPVAAASLAALQKLQRSPERIASLHANGKQFLAEAKAAGIQTGTSAGYAVIPAILESSLRALKVSAALLERGINVQPIVHPAVPEKSARLRFFLSSEHTPTQISTTVRALAEETRRH
jgi:8-amino-7-oxononanoate synthase